MRILLVEDNQATAATIERLLEAEGYAVRSVGSYREALQAASELLPDLLVSDIGLPGKDGLEVMKTMRRAYPNLKGLVVSGYASAADVESSREAGFSEHLAKPVDFEQLRAAIRRLLVV
jgi:CheY-like chemotaxis protein